MSDIVWSGHGLGIDEPHEQITDLVVYPCEVWCEMVDLYFRLYFKYGNQRPYRFSLAFEVYALVDGKANDLFWYWVMDCWKRVQHRISEVEKLART